MTSEGLRAHAGSVQPALVFVPDISGFTHFVTETPILHSKDLIAELLQTVIDTNRLGLEISEIEGDAVLFFRLGPPPRADELIDQITGIVDAFERTLGDYESRRICCCEACSVAHRLAIKMISHYGPVTVMLVDRYEKLLGPAVIVAHRLLKNPVTSSQYALVTEDTVSAQANLDAPAFPDAGWETGEAEYEGLGRIAYRFRSFASRERRPSEASTEAVVDGGLPLTTLRVNAPFDWTHHVITDLDLASTEGEIRNRLEPPHHVHRIGSRHTRTLQGSAIRLRTSANSVAPDRIWYAEEVVGDSSGSQAVFEIRPRGTGSELRVSLSDGASEELRNLYDRYARQIKDVSERRYRAEDWAAGVF